MKSIDEMCKRCTEEVSRISLEANKQIENAYRSANKRIDRIFMIGFIVVAFLFIIQVIAIWRAI